jgi:hypothetical protein
MLTDRQRRRCREIAEALDRGESVSLDGFSPVYTLDSAQIRSVVEPLSMIDRSSAFKALAARDEFLGLVRLREAGRARRMSAPSRAGKRRAP